MQPKRLPDLNPQQLTTLITSRLNGILQAIRSHSDHHMTSNATTEAKGCRIRHKLNKGYYRAGANGDPIFGELQYSARYDSVPKAQIIYDQLSRKQLYQGRLEIVPA